MRDVTGFDALSCGTDPLPLVDAADASAWFGAAGGPAVTPLRAAIAESRPAWIVNISSRAAGPKVGPPYPQTQVGAQILYGSSKSMLDRITTGAAMELFEYGIAVNSLAPEAAVMTENAAALVSLSFWKAGKPLIDPFCGSGTTLAVARKLGRALLIGRRIDFDAETFGGCACDAFFNFTTHT